MAGIFCDFTLFLLSLSLSNYFNIPTSGSTKSYFMHILFIDFLNKIVGNES